MRHKKMKQMEDIMTKRISLVILQSLLLGCCMLFSANSIAETFSYDQARLPDAKPWTSMEFQNNPEEFQFVIIGDRTGGANVAGTFALAVDQLNLLQPEFTSLLSPDWESQLISVTSRLPG